MIRDILFEQERTIMPISDNAWALGLKLKNLRIQHGYKLAEVAKAIGLTSPFLSMVEKGKSRISFENLEKIMTYYGLTISDLAGTPDASHRIHRLDQVARIGEKTEGVETFLLFHKVIAGEKLNVTFFRMEPGANIGAWAHNGSEFLYVTEGSLEITLNDPTQGNEEQYVLGKWDSIYHQSRIKHTCRNNASNMVTTFIVINFE